MLPLHAVPVVIKVTAANDTSSFLANMMGFSFISRI
jgi:hypothetical protein